MSLIMIFFSPVESLLYCRSQKEDAKEYTKQEINMHNNLTFYKPLFRPNNFELFCCCGILLLLVILFEDLAPCCSPVESLLYCRSRKEDAKENTKQEINMHNNLTFYKLLLNCFLVVEFCCYWSFTLCSPLFKFVFFCLIHL